MEQHGGAVRAEPRGARRSVGQPSQAATGRTWLAAVVLAAASLANAADQRGAGAHALRTWGGCGTPRVGSSYGLPAGAMSPSGSLLALRLKGGRGCTGVRNSCKQRKYKMREDVQKHAKRNRPIALSHKPCSGPLALSRIERAHGPLVIQMVNYPLPSPNSKHARGHVYTGQRAGAAGICGWALAIGPALASPRSEREC